MEKETLSRLRKNINSKNRPNNLWEIATDIKWLQENYGNTKQIAAELNVSAGMINTFLSALKVNTKTRELIKARKIDSVFAAHALKSFVAADQNTVSNALVDGSFSTPQARALVPLRNIFPDEPIELLMEVIRKSKDNKKYVNHFPMPDSKGLKKIESRIRMTAKGEPFSLTKMENIGVFAISKKGVKHMREDASMKNIGFHNYLLALFNPHSKLEEGKGGMM
ncbi:MAG: hypothetical protein AAF696_34985 [Bacteroidota bacterium]